MASVSIHSDSGAQYNYVKFKNKIKLKKILIYKKITEITEQHTKINCISIGSSEHMEAEIKNHL